MDPDATYLASIGGSGMGGHDDLDAGSFVLDAEGVRCALDLGTENYGVENDWLHDTTRHPNRWDCYCKHAEGHNTLLVNPDKISQQVSGGQVPQGVSKIVETGGNSDTAFSVLDLTPSYATEVDSLQRGFRLFDGCRGVLIQDEIQAKTPSEVYWFMHTAADTVIDADGRSATLTIDGTQMRAYIAPTSPADAVFTVMDAAPLSIDYDIRITSPAQSTPVGVTKLSVRMDGVPDATLAVYLVPTDIDPASFPGVTPLAEWDASE